jgi:predicted transcriptional regulator
VSVLVSNPRERLRALVAREPGLHLREIPRRAELSLSAVRYHLQGLAAEGAVVGERASGYVRYFPSSAFSKAERAVLAAARVKGQRLVLEALFAKGPLMFEGLRSCTGLSKGSLHWHLRRLAAGGAVEVGEAGRVSLVNRAAVEMALAITRPSAADTVADAAVEIFDPKA